MLTCANVQLLPFLHTKLSVVKVVLCTGGRADAGIVLNAKLIQHLRNVVAM